MCQRLAIRASLGYTAKIHADFSSRQKQHALYGIHEEDVETAIQAPDKVEAEGRYRVAYKGFSDRFRDKPLKVVYLTGGDEVIVVTAYPLRKR